MRVARAGVWFLAALVLCACGSMRSKPAPVSNPTVTFEPPATAAEPPATEAPKPDNPQAATPPDDSQPAASSASTPDCVPPAPKAKPAPPKPRPVHKEAPPQLPTAPVVVETPAGGIVRSEVKAVPVSVMSILGTKVQGPKHEDYGRVVDVLADGTGRVRVAIIDFGGFLGVGDRRIAIDWSLLRFNPADPSSVMLSVEHDKLKAVPDYKGDNRPQILMPAPPPAAPPSGDAKQ